MGQHPHEQCQSGMFWWGSKKNPPLQPESIHSRSHPLPATPSQSAACLATFRTSGRVSRLLEEAGN